MSDNVQMCPFCGCTNLNADMVDWQAKSLEPHDSGNTAKLHEHQCMDCSRSFWS